MQTAGAQELPVDARRAEISQRPNPVPHPFALTVRATGQEDVEQQEFQKLGILVSLG